MPIPPVQFPPDCVLPAPDQDAVRVLLAHIRKHGAPQLRGAPRVHQTTPVRGGGPDDPPRHPAWCTTALPDVSGYRILGMVDIQNPDEAEAYLNPEEKRLFPRTYLQAQGQDSANFEFVQRDLVQILASWVEQAADELFAAGLPDDSDALRDLNLEERASCMLAVAIESARKCSALVALFREMLEKCGVPTFGGYATRFPHLHSLARHPGPAHCLALCGSSVPHVRSKIAVAMLGLATVDDDRGTTVRIFGRGGEKRFASDLLLQWANWHHQRMTDLEEAGKVGEMALLAALSPKQFAACMLAAQVQIAQAALQTQAQRDEVAEWVPLAEERLSDLLAQWAAKERKEKKGESATENKSRSVPVALVQPRGMRLTADDPRWAFASEALAAEGAQSERVQLMLFMFLFHANLGLWQVPLDNPDRHPARNDFYESLAGVLRNACTEPAVGDTAQRLRNALEKMPLLTGLRDPQFHELLAGTTFKLPPCFNIYVGYLAPSVEDTVSQATNDKARDRIRQAHLLADVVAEMFLDIVRLRVDPRTRKPDDPPPVPGFHWGNIAYAEDRARYRQQAVGKKAIAALIESGRRWRPGDDPSAETDEIIVACDAYRRELAAYYKYLLTPDALNPKPGSPPRLIRFLQMLIPRNCCPPWPGKDAIPRPCAMCQIRPH